MAPLKQFLAVAMAGLVLLTASVSTDGAAMPAMTSSAVDTPAIAELTSAVARVGAAKNAATVVKGADAAADKEALDGASDRTFFVCKKFRVFKVCKRVFFKCRHRYVLHKLDAPDANGGVAAVNPGAAEDDIDAAARDANNVDGVSRTFYHKICVKLVCKKIKKCIVFHT